METYIVTLHSSAVSEKLKSESDYDSRQKLMEIEARNMIKGLGLKGTIERVYGGAFFGFVIRTSKENIQLLSKDPRIKYIEKDQDINLSPPKKES